VNVHYINACIEASKEGKSNPDTQRYSYIVKKKLSNALYGYNIYLTGELSGDKDEIIRLIYIHGGSVISKFNSEMVTHVLKGKEPKKSIIKKAEDSKIPIIDENFLQSVIDEEMEKQQEVVQSQTLSQGENSDNLKVADIKSIRSLKGEISFVVTYEGLSSDYTETISRERAIELCGGKKNKRF